MWVSLRCEYVFVCVCLKCLSVYFRVCFLECRDGCSSVRLYLRVFVCVWSCVADFLVRYPYLCVCVCVCWKLKQIMWLADYACRSLGKRKRTSLTPLLSLSLSLSVSLFQWQEYLPTCETDRLTDFWRGENEWEEGMIRGALVLTYRALIYSYFQWRVFHSFLRVKKQKCLPLFNQRTILKNRF